MSIIVLHSNRRFAQSGGSTYKPDLQFLMKFRYFKCPSPIHDKRIVWIFLGGFVSFCFSLAEFGCSFSYRQLVNVFILFTYLLVVFYLSRTCCHSRILVFDGVIVINMYGETHTKQAEIEQSRFVLYIQSSISMNPLNPAFGKKASGCKLSYLPL